MEGIQMEGIQIEENKEFQEKLSGIVQINIRQIENSVRNLKILLPQLKAKLILIKETIEDVKNESEKTA